MREKRIAIIVFYNEEGKILLQDRKGISKHGEDWAYFGGKIDPGESKEEALIREIKEELEFALTNYKYLGRYEKPGKLLKPPQEMILLIQEVFIAKITEGEFRSMVLHEGESMKWFTIEEAKNLNMYPLDPKILGDCKNEMG